jgi:hypothetical protein
VGVVGLGVVGVVGFGVSLHPTKTATSIISAKIKESFFIKAPGFL